MAAVVPQWTEQLYRPVGGQDHLGVGSVVTDRILPGLSPGINVLTPHPRYWAFYAFVVDEFWKQDLPRTNAALRRFLRRREAIYSAAGHLCSGDEHRSTPIGSRRVAPLIETGPKKYRADFDYMKSAGGGYGLYYATVMQTTGVIRLADKSAGLPADTVTPGLGKAVAEAFRESISATRYWKKYFDADEVPATAVEEYGNAACLCRLRDDPPDREPLVDVFLHGGQADAASARRTTLQMVLELAHQTETTGLSQDDFRRLLLYNATYDLETDEERAAFEPPAHLASVARRWRLSQLRELFNWSLNGMWQWVTDWGLTQDGDMFPVPIQALDGVLGTVDLGAITPVTSKLTDPIGKLIDECAEMASMTGSLDGGWELWTDLTEDALFELHRRGEVEGAEELGVLFLLYVMCLTRLREPAMALAAGPVDWAPVREGGIRRVGMQFALEQLRRDERNSATVGDVLRRVLMDHVVAQHERVALAKLPDDTYRFRHEGNRLRFFEQPTAFQRNDSRFNALTTTCAELGWSGFIGDDGHELSDEGDRLRREGDLGQAEDAGEP